MSEKSNYTWRINYSTLSKLCCLIAILLLGTNYLLYSFFKLESSSRLVIRVTAGILLLYSIIISGKVTTKDILLVIYAIYLIMINGIVSQNIAFIILAVVSIRKASGDIWQRISIYQFGLVALVFICLRLGVVSSQTTAFYGRVRNTLGFVNVNSASIFFMSSIYIWLLSIKKMSIRHTIISLVLSVLVYLYTDSRSAFGSMIIFMLCYYYLRKWHGPYIVLCITIIESLFFLSPVLLLFFSRFFPQLDFWLSYRLSLNYQYFAANSIREFIFGGSTIKEIDSLYQLLLFNGGIIFYAFVWLSVIHASQTLIKHDIRKLAFVISILAFGLTESGPLRCELICMIYFWYIILSSEKQRRKLNI